jgi:hypothetical protein
MRGRGTEPESLEKKAEKAEKENRGYEGEERLFVEYNEKLGYDRWILQQGGNFKKAGEQIESRRSRQKRLNPILSGEEETEAVTDATQEMIHAGKKIKTWKESVTASSLLIHLFFS